MAVWSSDARPGTLTSPGDDTTSVRMQGSAWLPLLPPHRPELSWGAGPGDPVWTSPASSQLPDPPYAFRALRLSANFLWGAPLGVRRTQTSDSG